MYIFAIPPLAFSLPFPDRASCFAIPGPAFVARPTLPLCLVRTCQGERSTMTSPARASRIASAMLFHKDHTGVSFPQSARHVFPTPFNCANGTATRASLPKTLNMLLGAML